MTGNGWAAALTDTAQTATVQRLDELDDQTLLQLHTTVMQLRHRIVAVQRHRRHNQEEPVHTPVAARPVAHQIYLYESGQATLDQLSPGAAASARRRAEAGDETRKRA